MEQVLCQQLRQKIKPVFAGPGNEGKKMKNFACFSGGFMWIGRLPKGLADSFYRSATHAQ
jgi:hypothetical protein